MPLNHTVTGTHTGTVTYTHIFCLTFNFGRVDGVTFLDALNPRIWVCQCSTTSRASITVKWLTLS